jgi:hypothetical protein
MPERQSWSVSDQVFAFDLDAAVMRLGLDAEEQLRESTKQTTMVGGGGKSGKPDTVSVTRTMGQ